MFRHHRFSRPVYPCVSVSVEVPTTQLDNLGMSRVSSSDIDVQSFNDSFPLVSEVSLDSQIVQGLATPVNLNDFVIDNVNPSDVYTLAERIDNEPSNNE